MLNSAVKDKIRQSFENIKNNMPNFKPRRVQNIMIAAVSKAITKDRKDDKSVLCVEAPTGTGKTIAYLLGAIPIAIYSKKKLIISSSNVVLQEQLINKDIVEIKKYCSLEFKCALVKGRSRYVCIRNLINLKEQKINSNLDLGESFVGNQFDKLSNMLTDYSTKKWNGEIDSLKHVPENSLWQKIACNRFTCDAKKCDFYQDCAFFKARSFAFQADVIITNHDLVLADLNTGNNVLPNVEESIFVFDEAHHLPQKALSNFSLNTSVEHIKNIIKQTIKVSERICIVTKQKMFADNSEQINSYLNDLVTLLENLDFDEEGIYTFKYGVVDESIKLICQNILIAIDYINDSFIILSNYYHKMRESSNIVNLYNDIGECVQHLTLIMSLFSSMEKTDDINKPPHSRWIRKFILANKKVNYHLNTVPIDVSAKLKDLIWGKAFSVVLVSATLTSLGSFRRFNEQLGLVDSENQYLRLPSSFDYTKVDFIVALFKSNPTEVFLHTQEVAIQLLKRIDTNKATLVLFASDKQMQKVATMISKKLACKLFVQGKHSKNMILKKHIKLCSQGKGSVIFGLDSFIEGLDLKGDNLSHVIIAKLGFSVPTSPIEKTTQNYLQSQNRNPFMEISLPDASLKLIQASGRLIRSETDSGKITIFDNRLVTKSYGKRLLDAMPNYNIVIEN